MFAKPQLSQDIENGREVRVVKCYGGRWPLGLFKMICEITITRPRPGTPGVLTKPHEWAEPLSHGLPFRGNFQPVVLFYYSGLPEPRPWCWGTPMSQNQGPEWVKITTSYIWKTQMNVGSHRDQESKHSPSLGLKPSLNSWENKALPEELTWGGPRWSPLGLICDFNCGNCQSCVG